MSNKIIKIFIKNLKKYSYILEKDFVELTNMYVDKRINFVKCGVKLFMKNVEKEMQIFNLDIDYEVDANAAYYFLDTVVSIKLMNNYMTEYIVYSPIKNHVFYTDNNEIFFNDKKIIDIKHFNNIKIQSLNPLFLNNLYICYLLLGSFQEILINKNHIQNNLIAIEMVKKLILKLNIKIEESDENIKIFLN